MATSAAIRQHLVDALGLDLIGPSWDDVARRHEQLPQPPSVWYTTGFLVPHVFEQEAGRTTEDEQLSFADLAGEEPSNGASNRLEKQEKDDDANDALDQANTRRSWFPSSLGLSFILEKGSTLEATVSWGDYSAPADGAEEKLWSRTPQRQNVKISIDRPDTSPDIPLEGQPQGLCLRWIARPPPTSSADRVTATSSPPTPCSPSGRPASATGQSRSKPAPGATAPSSRRAFTCCPRGIPIDWSIYCREPRSPEAKQDIAHMGPCPFHKGTPLPVLAVDEQIYRRLPCFLIATIDKFAALPWVGKTSSLFGNVSTYQMPTGSAAAGFWGPAEKGTGGLKIPHGRLLPPELVIQDELHLISGPLGTLAGLYETVIEGLMRPDATTPPPKIIASTATVRRAEAQIKALFARSQVRIFPPPGPEREDNFFSRTILDPDQARLYVGLSAPGRNLKGVLLRSYLGLMAAAQKGWNDNKAMGANNPADPYMTLLGYFSNLKELGVTRSILEDELGAQLEQFAKNRSLDMEGFNNPFASRKRPNEPQELTSRVNTAKISSTKDRLSKPYIDKDHLDVALATNMISVGLDISRLGLMVVLNQPKTAAEYIQATSRVGRQLSENPEQNKPGLVLVLLNPNRPRDRSHFELFPYWHQTFYRHVEATSCTPFASRALDRGLPGVVVAMARHGDPALAGAKGAMAADALQRIKAQIAQALQDRCIATGAADDSLDEHLPTEVRDHVIDLLEAWWKLTQEPEAKLQYWTHEEKGAGAGFLHTTLDTDPIYQAEGYKQFTTNWSLRDVEPSAPIRMVNFKEEITAED
jgi:hypothetical protein